METSTLSSLDKDYDDGVYDKANPPVKKKKRSRSRSPGDKASKLPALMLVCLSSLFVFSFMGTLVSGLYFNRRVTTVITATDCLGQSWIMFSSILGFLYIVLHLQAARKGEPINRTQPPSQHPLHSATVVVARLDTIAWMVSLIIASVAVARSPTLAFWVNLVACAAATPTIAIILCVAEKAVRPFDLPYLTSLRFRVSALIDTMPEVTTEDSISRRGSYSAPPKNRPNSHTQHAAAVAAANPGNTASISGPRPPPQSVKEARPWAFTNFDNRTKTELAASVNEATYVSDMRARVGGPRPLADSDIAYKRGVLAPPMCSDPKVERLPDRKLQKRPGQSTTPEMSMARGGSSGSGAWARDWSALKAETGYITPNSGSDVTPISTPRVPLGVPLFSSRIASRTLSPVVEVDDKRSSGGSSGSARPATAPASAPVPAPRVRTTSQYSAPASTTPTASRAGQAPLTGPRSLSYTQPTVTTTTTTTTTARPGRTLSYDSTGTLRPPPLATTTTASSSTRTPATRVRLVRAQDSATRTQAPDRPSYTMASLRRPQRLTGTSMSTASELRTPEDDRLFFVNPPRETPSDSITTGRPDSLRLPIPGSWRSPKLS